MKKFGCIAVCLALCMVFCSRCFAAQVPLWLLTYSTGSGEAYIYARPDGMRIEYLRHLVLLSTAPKWQPVFFSTKVKRIYYMPQDIKSLARASSKFVKYDFRLQRPSFPEENWFGLRVIHKTLPIKEFQADGMSGLHTDNAVRACRIDLFETKSLPLSTGAITSAQMYFSERYALATDCIPLGLRITDDSGKSLWIFKLRSASNTSGDLALYDRPKNLAIAKTQTAVYLDDRQQSEMKNIAKDLGIIEVPNKEPGNVLGKESGKLLSKP